MERCCSLRLTVKPKSLYRITISPLYVVSRQAKLFQGTDGHILRDLCIKYCELWQNKPKNERHFEIPRRERLSEADNNNMSFASQNLISNLLVKTTLFKGS